MSYGLDNLDGSYLQTTLSGILQAGVITISMVLVLGVSFAGVVIIALKKIWM